MKFRFEYIPGEYPVVAIVCPRQSGKTTLARYMFSDHKYLSMENLDIRHMAQDDPRGFLDDYGKNIQPEIENKHFFMAQSEEQHI